MSEYSDLLREFRDAATDVVAALGTMQGVTLELERRVINLQAQVQVADITEPNPVETPVVEQEPQPQPQPEPDPAPEPEPAEEKYPDLEDVRGILAALAQAGKAAQIKELLTKHGAEKLSDVPPEQRQALIDEAKDLS